MIVACSQPRYLPFLGFLKRMGLVDTFVILDTVPYRRTLEHRGEIELAHGGRHFLTVPCRVNGREQSYRETIVQHDGWDRKHFETIRHAYGKAPFWSKYGQHVADTYANINLLPPDYSFVDLCVLFYDQLWRPIYDLTGTTFILASALPVPYVPGPQYLLELCMRLGATDYLSGFGGHSYLDPMIPKFEHHGVTVSFDDSAATMGHRWRYSALHYLLNNGPVYDV